MLYSRSGLKQTRYLLDKAFKLIPMENKGPHNSAVRYRMKDQP